MMGCIAWIVSGFEKLMQLRYSVKTPELWYFNIYRIGNEPYILLLCFSYAILKVEDGVFEVDPTLVDTYLGSNDIDKVETREMSRSLAYILCFLIYSQLLLNYTLAFNNF